MDRIAFEARVTYGTSGRTFGHCMYNKYAVWIQKTRGRQEGNRIVIEAFKTPSRTAFFGRCLLSIDPALAVPLAEAILAAAADRSQEERVSVENGEISRTHR